MVNGKSILQIIPSRFSTALSFTIFLNLSISFFMLQSSLSILDKFSSNFFPSYWPGYLILPHYGFLRFSDVLLHSNSRQSTVVLRFEIQQLSLVLHSSKLIPPHWLLGLGFVMRLVRHPSCATRWSFVT